MPILHPDRSRSNACPTDAGNSCAPCVTESMAWRTPSRSTTLKTSRRTSGSDPIGLLDWSKVDVAGVIHDYLYQNPGAVKGIETRRHEDDVWRKIAGPATGGAAASPHVWAGRDEVGRLDLQGRTVEKGARTHRTRDWRGSSCGGSLADLRVQWCSPQRVRRAVP